jgi:vancomycin aglycone glucosyltransferase
MPTMRVGVDRCWNRADLLWFRQHAAGIPPDTVAAIDAACGMLGERALICTGPNDCTQIPHSGYVKIVEAVNHAAALPACRAVVHHGGAGTTAAGLRAGVPALVLWTALDQPIWAGVIEHLKVGAARGFSVSNEASLVSDLRSILSPQCVTRARQVAASMTKAAESVARAADLLEDAARPQDAPGRRAD